MSVEEADTPGWETIFRIAVEAMMASVRVMLPGRITRYDADRQMASVLPLIQDSYVDETGVRQARTLTEIHSVPVMHLGPPRARTTYPVQKGDLCILWFSSSSLTQWILRGGGPVDPRDDRHHDLNDAVAMVGLHSPADPPTEAPTDAVVHHAGDGVVIKLGGDSGTQATLKADTFLSALDTLVGAIATAVESIPGGAAAGAAIVTALEAFQATALRSSYKTTKTEVK